MNRCRGGLDLVIHVFIGSFIQLSNNYVLRDYCMSGPVLAPGAWRKGERIT